MDLGLRGCGAIVSGASSGMGRAIAGRLAAEGCDVTLFARRAGLLDQAVAEISALPEGGRAHAVVATAPPPRTSSGRSTRHWGSSAGSTSWSTTPADHRLVTSETSPMTTGSAGSS